MIQQGQTIGIIGGGQLGQMMALDAKYTGMKVIVLDPTPACPAGQVADEQIVAEYADVKAIEELARRSDASLGTPLPKTAGSVTLPSTAVVFNALRANGELKAVQGIRIGYQWKTNRNATSVTLVPTYYVKIGNQWENYQVLIHEGGRQWILNEFS